MRRSLSTAARGPIEAVARKKRHAAGLATAALAAVLVLGCGSEGVGTGATTANSSYPQWMRSVERAGHKSFQVPLIALNCPVGNAFRCDRIVFSFALRLPARHLEARVAGRPVRGLRTAPYGGEGPRHGETGLTWSGHVRPAGLTDPASPLHVEAPRPNYWAGEPPVRARVLVIAELKSGETVREVFPFVRLQAGYG